MTRKMTIAEQLTNYRVNEVTGCHEWTKATRKVDGYGEFFNQGKKWSAHRAAYLHYKGEIPPGMLVRHTCDNPCCINPEHLLLGTDADNNADKMARGRHYTGSLQYWREKLSEYDLRRIIYLFKNGYGYQNLLKLYRLNHQGWAVVKERMQGA